VLGRGIDGSSRLDATSCYPLFSCRSPSLMAEDFEELAATHVACVLVPDPMDSRLTALAHLADVVIPYKHHVVVEEPLSLQALPGQSHARNIRRGLRRLTIEPHPSPDRLLDDWCELYGVLVARHRLTGLRAFSREAFEDQFRTPGLFAFRALLHGRTVGMHLWYVHAHAIHSHLSAFTAEGYANYAAYALQWEAIQHFTREGLRIDLGAGLSVRGDDGLSRFKQGFSRATRQVNVLGRILQPGPYAELCERAGASAADAGRYFPPYRLGETA
jgi:hypothetical protein